MRITNTKNMKIMVMSGQGAQCPRFIARKDSVVLRDDYHGKIATKGKLIGRIISV